MSSLLFKSSFELTISPENTGLVALAAQEFWYFPEMVMTPEEIICREFEQYYSNIRSRIYNRLVMQYGVAQKNIVDAIMTQYDESKKSSTWFTAL